MIYQDANLRQRNHNGELPIPFLAQRVKGSCPNVIGYSFYAMYRTMLYLYSKNHVMDTYLYGKHKIPMSRTKSPYHTDEIWPFFK